MQRDQSQQLVGQFHAIGGHAARVEVAGQLGVGQVVGLNALAKHLAVGANAADRNAGKVDAVVALFAPDQAGFGALALGAPVGARHFERGVGAFRTRASKEHVVQAVRRERGDFVGQLKRQRVAKLEGGGIVQGADLAADCLGDLGAGVAQAASPQTRETVHDFATGAVGVVRAFGANHHARVGFEVAVAGVGHPVRLHPGSVHRKSRSGGDSALALVGGGFMGFHGGLRLIAVKEGSARAAEKPHCGRFCYSYKVRVITI